MSGSSRGDAVFAGLATGSGIFVLVLLGAIIVLLFAGALQAFVAFGPGFVVNTDWDPVKHIYGAFIPIYGTVVSSVLAMIVGVPVAFGIAFFLTEMAPNWMRRPVGTAIELLAAVPSIIFGMWGLFVVVPIFSDYIEPWADDTLGQIPGIGALFTETQGGTGIATAALILSVMIIPFITAIMRDVFLTVPPMFKESAYGIGCTRWEVMRSIVLPYTRTAVVGGIMLGLGRALGETMAVTYIIGSTDRLGFSLFANGNTISSKIAYTWNEAGAGSIEQSTLMALGFILFVISFLVLTVSRLLLRPRART